MKVQLPEDSLAAKYLPVDFKEVIAVDVDNSTSLNPGDIQIAFWTDMPAWVNFLFKLRNLLVKPFGLKGGGGDVSEFVSAIRNGGSYELMRVTDKSEKETIICLDDKHLQAYISVYVELLETNNRQRVFVTTFVNFHKRLGKVYFYTIYPFHYIIVRQQAKRVINKLLKR